VANGGTCAAEGCESGQVWKEAALSGYFRVTWECLQESLGYFYPKRWNGFYSPFVEVGNMVPDLNFFDMLYEGIN